MIRWALLILAFLFADVALAQTATGTAAPSLDELLTQGQGVYDAFKMLGILAGITAAAQFLVNLSKLGFIDDFIVKKQLKWIRPMLAVLVGFLGGLGAALAQNKPVGTAILFTIGGMFAGGGSIALHELFNALKEMLGKKAPA